jgi:catechol 2,3-dioxygenase-like lactoylglutathione lyase family enzyme
MCADRQNTYEIALAHFIVARDIERSRRFYTDVLGGTTIRSGEPSYVALANSWIIINVGGAPTDDKPTVTLEPPPNPDRTSAFLNSGSPISRRFTQTGAHVAHNSSRRRNSIKRKCAVTYETPTAT